MHTQEAGFKSRIVATMDVVQALDLTDIKVELSELKEIIKVLSERVDVKPSIPPPMP